MLDKIYHWLCRIIQIIIYMFETNVEQTNAKYRHIGIENILEETFTKLEKNYYKGMLVPEVREVAQRHFTNDKNSD